MVRNIIGTSLAAAFLVFVGCAPATDHLRSNGDTSFSDDGPAPSQSINARADRDVLARGPVTASVPAYTVPEKLKAAVNTSFPELNVGQALGFKVDQVRVSADPRTSFMSLRGTLKMTGHADEAIELVCHFDPSITPWTCADMYPTDKKIAAQKRLQATAACDQLVYDNAAAQYRCKNLGVELYVSVGGKTESQLFQSQPFELRYASAGDDFTPETDKAASPKTLPAVPDVPNKTASGKFTNRVLPEDNQVTNDQVAVVTTDGGAKITPNTPVDADVVDDRVTESDAVQALADSNVAVEVTSPLPTPAPAAGQFSIPGIESIKAKTANVPAQAFGAHADGYLRDAAELPESGRGYVRRFQDGRDFGTNFTIETLLRVAGDLDGRYPAKPPIVIANIAQKHGGHMCSAAGNCHASHQTGLDVDVVLPSKEPVRDMFDLCKTQKVTRSVHYRSGKMGTVTSTVCVPGTAISPNLDTERAWSMLQDLVCGPSDVAQPVLAMFLDHEVKAHLCAYAKAKGENLRDASSCAFRTLQAIKHETGHFNHVHVRLRCPGNSQCRNSLVNLTNTTGC